jgi:hypothetical protein
VTLHNPRLHGLSVVPDRHQASPMDGLVDGARLVKLIPEIITKLRLDLSGLTVLTEAASGAYVVTPVIAALAGAHRVIALTRESRYASVNAVIAQTRELASVFGVDAAVEICMERSPDLFARADIITNLGFVRPIDAEAVEAMKPTAIVSLMCEAWELRPGDVDIAACRRKGILVIGTDEHHPAVDVFPYSGWLALKLLLEAGVEIHRNKILVVSRDRFGLIIEENLRRAHVDACLVQNLKDLSPADLRAADALVTCDYAREDCVIGSCGDITPGDLAAAAPAIKVVQFAGLVDVSGLQANGIFVYPGEPVPPHRMVRTLAALGSRPVVELHTAGLKVGEVAARIRDSVADPAKAEATTRSCCPFAQVM